MTALARAKVRRARSVFDRLTGPERLRAVERAREQLRLCVAARAEAAGLIRTNARVIRAARRGVA